MMKRILSSDFSLYWLILFYLQFRWLERNRDYTRWIVDRHTGNHRSSSSWQWRYEQKWVCRTVRMKISSRLVIGSGQSIGDQVTRHFTDACCYQLEIPAP
jgi:hypothetical protein